MRWIIKDHVLTISGHGAASGDYSPNGFFLHTPWQEYAAAIGEIIIEPGCNYVGSSLFAELHNLKRVIVPYDLYALWYHAFENCENLECVRFNGGRPMEMPEDVFEGCGDITVEYPESDSTWDVSVGQNFGASSINWVSYYRPIKSLCIQLNEWLTRYSIPDGSFTLNVTINGRSEHQIGDCVAIAAYDKNGKMLRIDCLHPTFMTMEDETLAISYDNGEPEIFQIKAFWLSPDCGFLPLTEAVGLMANY